jgi:hypothetical protein
VQEKVISGWARGVEISEAMKRVTHSWKMAFHTLEQ